MLIKQLATLALAFAISGCEGPKSDGPKGSERGHRQHGARGREGADADREGRRRRGAQARSRRVRLRVSAGDDGDDAAA